MTKTDQNDKKRKGFDQFWQSKCDQNGQFLIFEPTKFSTRVFMRPIALLKYAALSYYMGLLNFSAAFAELGSKCIMLKTNENLEIHMHTSAVLWLEKNMTNLNYSRD